MLPALKGPQCPADVEPVPGKGKSMPDGPHPSTQSPHPCLLIDATWANHGCKLPVAERPAGQGRASKAPNDHVPVVSSTSEGPAFCASNLLTQHSTIPQPQNCLQTFRALKHAENMADGDSVSLA